MRMAIHFVAHCHGELESYSSKPNAACALVGVGAVGELQDLELTSAGCISNAPCDGESTPIPYRIIGRRAQEQACSTGMIRASDPNVDPGRVAGEAPLTILFFLLGALPPMKWVVRRINLQPEFDPLPLGMPLAVKHVTAMSAMENTEGVSANNQGVIKEMSDLSSSHQCLMRVRTKRAGPRQLELPGNTSREKHEHPEERQGGPRPSTGDHMLTRC